MMLFNNDNQNSKFKVGTGNKLTDALLGGLTGLADATQDRGQYAPIFNWGGNGLAKGGVQYFAKPNYRDYASGGRMLGAALGSYGRDNEDIKRPSELFNTLFGGESLKYPLNTTTYQLPTIGNIDFGTVGGVGDSYKNLYDYSLPTQQINYKLPWE